ncbi:MAG: 50S ribosomal protein L4 [Rhodospirillaceae bacterium]|nr:50S ribosomal protein L4 [Rhodospirillaceae bacterium]
MKSQVTNLDNENIEEIELPDNIFALPVRPDLLHRVVRWQLAKRRSGNHKTRTVSEISGTTAKPWNQKGSGRARAGSTRSTQFRGGAVAHGPRPRKHTFALPKKVRRLALKTALSSKISEGKLVIIDKISVDEFSTSGISLKFKKLGWNSVLIIDSGDLDNKFFRSVRNIPNVDIMVQQGTNVYDILRKETLVLTKAAVEALKLRLS